MLVRALGALVLVALGILLFFVTSEDPNVWTVVVAALSVLIGVAVVVAPWVVRLTRDLSDERAARVREAGRAEMAAHLHDSVLQTLALIQQKAGPHSDAARLARAQERDLRDWLFTGSPKVRRPGRGAPRIATTVERDYAVHVDVVAAGRVPGRARRPARGRAGSHPQRRPACRRQVSVYVESSPTAIEVSVTDRGPGLDLGDIPADRMGVRESILARMQRVGGTAVCAPVLAAPAPRSVSSSPSTEEDTP